MSVDEDASSDEDFDDANDNDGWQDLAPQTSEEVIRDFEQLSISPPSLEIEPIGHSMSQSDVIQKPHVDAEIIEEPPIAIDDQPSQVFFHRIF